MFAKSIFAATALASLAAAVPMAQPPFAKRDIAWETHTEVAFTTVPVTVTHWLEPGETAPAAVGAAGNSKNGHGHRHGGHGQHGKPSEKPAPTQPAAPPAAPSSAESAPQPPPAPSSYQQPTSQPPPPAPTTEAAPVPTSTQQAAPPAYTPPSQPSPSQPSNNGGGSGSNGLSGMAAAGVMHSGDVTHWTPALGACGWTNSESEAVVAIAESLFDQYDVDGNPNHNKLCGKYVSIIGSDGSPTKAKVVDRCGGCSTTDLDLSPSLFETVEPKGDGRVSGVKWSFT